MEFIDLERSAKEISNDRNGELASVIIKEMLHVDILRALSNSDIGGQIVFQGGTALRLCYGGNRYSEDLDFVTSNSMGDFDKPLFKEFEKVFINTMKKKYNLEAEFDYPKNEDNLVQKWTAKILLPTERKKTKINIEICRIPSYDYGVKTIENFYKIKGSNYLDPILLNVESLDEILADKIIAFGARAYMKYRDLWDIKWLTDKNIQINQDLIDKKIIDYKIEDFQGKVKEKLEIMNNENLLDGFKSEISRFLPIDVYNKIVRFNMFDDIKKAVNNCCDKLPYDLDKSVTISFDDDIIKREPNNDLSLEQQRQ